MLLVQIFFRVCWGFSLFCFGSSFKNAEFCLSNLSFSCKVNGQKSKAKIKFIRFIANTKCIFELRKLFWRKNFRPTLSYELSQKRLNKNFPKKTRENIFDLMNLSSWKKRESFRNFQAIVRNKSILFLLFDGFL